jgi:hypothetical protein
MLTTENRTDRLSQIRQISHLLDNAIAIPGTQFRVGLDPLLGLLPGLGDVAGLAFSGYILLEASRWKLPAATLWRMMANIGIDWLLGNVPVLGDLFDVVWKANHLNLQLLEAHIEHPDNQTTQDRILILAAFLVLGLLFVITAGIASAIIVNIWRLLPR